MVERLVRGTGGVIITLRMMLNLGVRIARLTATGMRLRDGLGHYRLACVKSRVARWSFRISAAIAALTLALAVLADEPRVEISAPGGAVRTTVRVEIADSEGQRRFGLMYRTHLDEDAGMIFVFSRPTHLSFWMKHTEIPLDMIFADVNGRIVGIVANAEPLSEQLLGVEGDSQYVLEVNGGFCQRHRVTAGDLLKFVGFVPQAKD